MHLYNKAVRPTQYHLQYDGTATPPPPPQAPDNVYLQLQQVDVAHAAFVDDFLHYDLHAHAG